MIKYQVFTDGSSSRKNKTIGTSYIVFKEEDKNPIEIFSKGFQDKQARNGIAELLGVYYFLYNICCCESVCILEKSEITIYSDSQYVVKELTEWFQGQIVKNFFDIKNKEIIIYILWMLSILKQEGYIIKFKWIKGHQDKETFEAYGNNYADSFAVSSHQDIFIDDLEDIEDFEEDLKLDVKENNLLSKIRKFYLGL